MTRILVLVGHPRGESYCDALAQSYADAATQAGHEVRLRRLAELPVDLHLPQRAGAGPGWVAAQQRDIAWAEHWVLATPMWWGGVPAALKSYFDQVLAPGFAFHLREDGRGWDQLLAGRSARLLLTTDTPPWVLRWLWGAPLVTQLKRQVFGYCGMRFKGAAVFGIMRQSTPARRADWLRKAAKLGQRAA